MTNGPHLSRLVQALAPLVVAAIAQHAAATTGTLSLTTSPCPGGPDDDLVTVTLSMTSIVGGTATGFQAFVNYDTTKLTFNAGMSSYTMAPFPQHITSMACAEHVVPCGALNPGHLILDGSAAFNDPGTAADSVLATLVFNVNPLAECMQTAVTFEMFGTFSSELSGPVAPPPNTAPFAPTTLSPTGLFSLDDTPPTIVAPANLVVNADAGVCSAILFPQVFEFNANPPLAASQAPGVFYVDRYPPYLFRSALFDGGLRLQHQINAADSLANRPPAYQFPFYDTQGRKYDINSGVGSSVSIDLYIGSDWGANQRRADLWLTTFDDACDISGFPIVGFANLDGTPAGDTFRIFTQDTGNNPNCGLPMQPACTPGWVDLGLPPGFMYGKWYTLRITLNATDYLFEVIDGMTTVLSYTDNVTFGSTRIGNTIIQAFNFGATYDVWWDNLRLSDGARAEGCDNCSAVTVTATRSDMAALTAPFPTGVTTVTWSATDACGNTSTAMQTVTVNALNTVAAIVTIRVGSSGPTAPPIDRCIRFYEDCIDRGSVSGVPTSPAFSFNAMTGLLTGALTFTVPCGNHSGHSLCAKDEQHTKWDTVSLAQSGAIWQTATPFLLLPGDNDNDGDVDINDVTFLIATYGIANPGCPAPFPAPCPFVLMGNRNADFSDNCVVSLEDYSLLSVEFLTASQCDACPAVADERKFDGDRTWLSVAEIDPGVRDHVDFNGDGVFDDADVRVFELMHGLPDTLSSKMIEHRRKVEAR